MAAEAVEVDDLHATIDVLRAENGRLEVAEVKAIYNRGIQTARDALIRALETRLAARDATIEELRAALEEKSLAVIEARNPGIDIEEVRQQRAAAAAVPEDPPCDHCGGWAWNGVGCVCDECETPGAAALLEGEETDGK